MTEEKPTPPKAFTEQACTIGKTGSTVTVECDDPDLANELFDWLTEQGDHPTTQDLLNKAEADIIVRAGICGHHFTAECNSCVSAREWTDGEMDNLRAERDGAREELAVREWELAGLKDTADKQGEELARVTALGDALAGAVDALVNSIEPTFAGLSHETRQALAAWNAR